MEQPASAATARLGHLIDLPYSHALLSFEIHKEIRGRYAKFGTRAIYTSLSFFFYCLPFQEYTFRDLLCSPCVCVRDSMFGGRTILLCRALFFLSLVLLR